jgi:hypothetical protein
MKRVKILSVITILLVFVMTNACKESYLEVTPNGSLPEQVLANYEGVDALLIGAYSMMDGYSSQGTGGWEATNSGWVYGSIRGMEANKGTDSGDQPDINPIQKFEETATNPYLNLKWRSIYEAISRCNAVIRTTKVSEESGTITSDEAATFINQARALRGFYHFEAWRLWANMETGAGIPYINEETVVDSASNTEDVRPLIIADLEAGVSLPNNMGQVGRFNKTVAQVLTAKAEMQMNKNYSKADGLLSSVIESGTNPAGGAIGLAAKYGDIFDAENRNGIEAIYTVQYSVNDGSGGWNAGQGEVLNFPYKSGGSPGGCCGFFNPTQDFVNSFNVDENGLPLSDYNAVKVTNDQGIVPIRPWDEEGEYKKDDKVTVADPDNPHYAQRHFTSLTGDDDNPNEGNSPLSSPSNWQFDFTYTEFSGVVDPRLDWAVGRRGVPYWDWGDHTGQDWIRDQSYSGPYNPKKQVYKRSQEGELTEVGNWTSGWTANGYRLIRYADVLLLKAECEAMTNSDDLGLGEVNAIRRRAANKEGFVQYEDEDKNIIYGANYDIGTYTSFAGQQEAMDAIKRERKLELGMEGHRYYDLQRWGDVQAELNRIMSYEKTQEWGDALYGNATIGPEDVNFPIPQRQIDLMDGNLVQNR